MAANKPKGFVKTSEKAYLAWVTMPGVGTRVPGTRYATEKAAPYVLFTIGGNYRITSGNDLAGKFTFEDGSAINAETVRARLTGGVMKWTAVKRKSDVPDVWARYEPAKGTLGNFTVCPDINGEPELTSARKVKGDSFVAMYNMARFPNVATREQLSASPAKPEQELAAPKKLSDTAAQHLASAQIDANRYTGKFAEGLSATKSGIDARDGLSAAVTGINKVDKGIWGGLQVIIGGGGTYTAKFTLKNDAPDKVSVEIKGENVDKWSGVIPLETFAKGGAVAQVASYRNSLVKLAAKKPPTASLDAFSKLRLAVETKVLPSLEEKFAKVKVVQIDGKDSGGKKLVIKPKSANVVLGTTMCIMFPTDSGFAYRFAATAQNTAAERIVQGLLDIKPAFENNKQCPDLARLTAGVLKGYNAIALYERREKERAEREKNYDFDLVGMMKDKGGAERYVLQRRGTDKKTAATREQLIALAEAKRVSNVYVQTINNKKKIRVLGGKLASMQLGDTSDIANSRVSVAAAEADAAERFVDGVLAKLIRSAKSCGHSITMSEFTPAAPDGNGANSAGFACDLLTANPTRFVFNLKEREYIIAGQGKKQCGTATEMAKGIVAAFIGLLGLPAASDKAATDATANDESAADIIATTAGPLDGVADDFNDDSNVSAASDSNSMATTEDGVRSFKAKRLSAVSSYHSLEKAADKAGFALNLDGWACDDDDVKLLTSDAQSLFDESGGAVRINAENADTGKQAASFAIWNDGYAYSHDASDSASIKTSRQECMSVRGFVEAVIRDMRSRAAMPVDVNDAPQSDVSDIGETPSALSNEPGNSAVSSEPVLSPQEVEKRNQEVSFIEAVVAREKDKNIALTYRREESGDFSLLAERGGASLPFTMNVRGVTYTMNGEPRRFTKVSELAASLIPAIDLALSELSAKGVTIQSEDVPEPTDSSEQAEILAAIEADVEVYNSSAKPVGDTLDAVEAAAKAAVDVVRAGDWDKVETMYKAVKNSQAPARNAVDGVKTYGESKITEIRGKGLSGKQAKTFIAAYREPSGLLGQRMTAIDQTIEKLDKAMPTITGAVKTLEYLNNLADAQRGVASSIKQRAADISAADDLQYAQDLLASLREDAHEANTNADSARVEYAALVDKVKGYIGNKKPIDTAKDLCDEICAVSISADKAIRAAEKDLDKVAEAEAAAQERAAQSQTQENATDDVAPPVLDDAVVKFTDILGEYTEKEYSPEIRHLLGMDDVA